MRVSTVITALAITLSAFAEGSWETFIPSADNMAGLTVGSPRAEVMSALAGLAARVDCASAEDAESCKANVTGLGWAKVKPARSDYDALFVFFRGGRLIGVMFATAIPKFQEAESAYIDARAALRAAGLTSKAADQEQLRRFSRTMPGKITHGTEWASGERRALAWLLRRRGAGAVLVCLGELP